LTILLNFKKEVTETFGLITVLASPGLPENEEKQQFQAILRNNFTYLRFVYTIL